MADITGNARSDITRLVGSDEQFAADVINEKGFNKLYVKATAAPQILGNLFFEYLMNGANENMKVNGSVTPVVFQWQNTTANDLIVNSLSFELECVGPGAAGFAGSGSALANGLLIEIKSEDVSFAFKPIKKNYHFDSLFAQGNGSSFQIYNGTGNDYVGAKFAPASPFILKKTGTYGTNDYIRVTVRDDLSGSIVTFLKALIFGAFDT